VTAAVNYVVDTNIYIEAYRRYYPFGIVDSFWRLLEQHAKTGRVVSIDRVKSELEIMADPLSDWARNRCSEAFVSTDRPDVIYHFTAMMKWVQAQDFTPAAKAEFATEADGWVVAYAKAGGHTVVTMEKYEPNCKKKVKMPNVCKEFGVQYVNTFEMLKALGAKLG
jgi:hypothetical protein